MSVTSSASVVANVFTAKRGARWGSLVMMLITPPIASEPYSVDIGPLMTSICWMSDGLMPLRP